MHDWGGVGLALAQRMPERIERLVAIDVVPFLPGYRWHWLARLWRRPVRGRGGDGAGVPAGRAALPAAGPRRAGAGRVRPRDAARDPAPLPREPARRCWPRPAARLGTVAAPALVVHGADDPYIPPRFADGLAAALGDGRAVHVPGAGHWPWLDEPAVIEQGLQLLLRLKVSASGGTDAAGRTLARVAPRDGSHPFRLGVPRLHVLHVEDAAASFVVLTVLARLTGRPRGRQAAAGRRPSVPYPARQRDPLGPRPRAGPGRELAQPGRRRPLRRHAPQRLLRPRVERRHAVRRAHPALRPRADAGREHRRAERRLEPGRDGRPDVDGVARAPGDHPHGRIPARRRRSAHGARSAATT